MLTFEICRHGHVLSLIVSQTYIALIQSSSLRSRFQLLCIVGSLEKVLFVCDFLGSWFAQHRPDRSLAPQNEISCSVTFGRVLKTTVNHSAQKLRLQHEIFEVRSVNTNIVAPRIQ